MPIIELYLTGNVDEIGSEERCLQELIDVVGTFEFLRKDRVRAMATTRHHYTVGEGHAAGFVHCRMKILSGHDPENKKRLADAMFKKLTEFFKLSMNDGKATVTFELNEMEREFYRMQEV